MATLRDLARAFSRLPAAVRAPLWMVAATSLLGTMNVIVRHVSFELHPFEIAFFRNLFGVLFFLPWFVQVGPSSFRTRRLGLHSVRAATLMVSMVCWFSALALMPIAEATALNFTTPLFATVGAALFLREAVGWRRWVATAVGFAGALVILRPGAAALSWPALLALGAAAFGAPTMLMVKPLARTDSAATIVFYMNFLTTPFSLPPALVVWVMPSPEAWAGLVGIGVLATLGQVYLIRAFAVADASAVLPFDFARLPMVAVLGYLFYDERPDAWTWIGGAVIFAATLYTARREVRAGKPAGFSEAQRP